jgi:hypothetical protein
MRDGQQLLVRQRRMHEGRQSEAQRSFDVVLVAASSVEAMGVSEAGGQGRRQIA